MRFQRRSFSIAADGFVSALSGLFGCLPITSFSQNVGLVSRQSRKQIYDFHRAYMVLAGLFPMFGTLLATLPEAVLGGCTLMMFGNIVISGLQMIAKCGFSQRNIIIAALSLSIGLGFTQVPEIFSIFPQIIQNVFAENCVAVVFLVSIILNLVLPKNMEAHKQ
ncbi:MAG: solute carrier family 23 protein [Hominilimicola sp.]